MVGVFGQPTSSAWHGSPGSRRTIGFAVAVALLGIAGCHRQGLTLAPVSGVVTLDGAPVADAGVMFAPLDAPQGLPAVGATDENGAFTLMTANQAGAIVGQHRVAVSKTEAIVVPQARGLPLYKSKSLLPPKFGSFDTSGITATVADENNQLTIELSSE